MSAQAILKEYLDYLEVERGRAVATRHVYAHYIERFFKAEKIQSIADITEGRIRDFRLGLARENLKKATQSQYVIALRSFLKYLVKRGYETVPPERVELLKVPARQVEIISHNELERLLDAPQTNTLLGLRDKAMLELFFSTGLRLSELCALDRFIDVKKGELTVRGKGDKVRLVFLSPAACTAISCYMDKRTDAETPLFVSILKGKIIGRITPRAVERMIARYGVRAGIVGKKLSPHTLRHCFATDLLGNGADIRSVQEMLGHASVATTQIYTHVTNKHLREVYKAFHGKRRNEDVQ